VCSVTFAAIPPDAGRVDANLSGISALCMGMRLLGKEVELTTLVDSRYVGSKISTPLEGLKLAANDNGFYTGQFQNLTTVTLRTTRFLWILPVKETPFDAKPTRFLVYVGESGDEAVVFDGYGVTNKITFSDLRSRWDGSGLAISEKPVEPSSFLGWDRALLIAMAFALVAIVFALRRIEKAIASKTKTNSVRARIRMAVFQAAGFLLASIILASMFHSIGSGGILARNNVLDSIKDEYFVKFLPKWGYRDVEKMFESQNRGTTVLVDARWPDDYDAGHIESAVNIPPDTSVEDCKRLLMATQGTTLIVVYCQSADCPYADLVAQTIRRGGRTNIAHYTGGWAEWTAKNDREIASAGR
jgi:rhodanese-related sulfurtransferase